MTAGERIGKKYKLFKRILACKGADFDKICTFLHEKGGAVANATAPLADLSLSRCSSKK